MDEPDMPEDSLLSGVKGDLHKSNYKDGIQEWKQAMRYYMSNKSDNLTASRKTTNHEHQQPPGRTTAATPTQGQYPSA